jgi:hypothetical protein
MCPFCLYVTNNCLIITFVSVNGVTGKAFLLNQLYVLSLSTNIKLKHFSLIRFRTAARNSLRVASELVWLLCILYTKFIKLTHNAKVISFCTSTRFYLREYSMNFSNILVPRSRMRGAIPPLPQYVFMAWCLVKHRDNFTFTFTLPFQ